MSESLQEQWRQASRRYYQRHRERVRARQKAKSEWHRNYSKEHHRKNKPAYRERTRQWRKNNPDGEASIRHQRRALQRAASINLAGIKDFFRSVRASRRVTCYYCQRQIPGKAAHFDHIIALVNGGEHSVRNLCVSCPSCNLSKQDKPVALWIKVGQQFLAL